MPEDSEPFEKPVSAAVRLIVLKHWVAGYRRLVFMAILGQVFFIFKKPPLNYDDNTALSRAIDYTDMLAKGASPESSGFLTESYYANCAYSVARYSCRRCQPRSWRCAHRQGGYCGGQPKIGV